MFKKKNPFIFSVGQEEENGGLKSRLQRVEIVARQLRSCSRTEELLINYFFTRKKKRKNKQTRGAARELSQLQEELLLA
jgi:hypothetical protein